MNAPAQHEHTPLDHQHDTDPPSTLRTSSQGESADGTRHVMAIWEGGHASCVVPLEGRIVIGRAPTADLRIASNSVSREHAVIIAGNPPLIQDLWSTNGTRVEDRLLEPAESAPLLPGRVVEIGSALLVLQDDSAPLEVPKFGERPALAPAASEAKMDRLHRLIALAATVSLNVTLQGEASVGKEMIARRIHQRSSRSRKPFVKVNCARLADSEIGRELLGRSGPGPVRGRLFEMASGGTVFLEEVGALSLAMQAELLHAVGDAEVLSATSLHALPLDVRFISSTSNDFSGLIGGGAFRSDLHYWLGGIHLYVPPLRERADEILRLARQFLDQASMHLALPTLFLSKAAEAWLKGYPWPSNIRELREVVVEAGTAAAPGTIEVEHLEMGLEIVHALGIDLDAGAGPPSAERSTIPDSDH
jgi:two-component system, NtrC family, response regulator AtoC